MGDIKQERAIKLYNAVEAACGNLPEGFVISLKMENGAGWIEFTDSEGSEIMIDQRETDHMDLPEEIQYCVDFANDLEDETTHTP